MDRGLRGEVDIGGSVRNSVGARRSTLARRGIMIAACFVSRSHRLVAVADTS